MPLSEHEEEILAQIERQLESDDPRFIARARRTPRSPARRLKLAMVGFLVGFLLLLALTIHVGLAAVGLVLMYVSVVSGVRAVGGLDALRDRLRAQQKQDG